MSDNNNSKYDLDFYWDPICPFAWITSRWIHKVKEARPLNVDWKFICLRIINKDKNYEKFPEGYELAHTGGLKMLRTAAAARHEHGREVMEPLYTAFGESIWDRPPPSLNGTSLNDEKAELDINFLVKTMTDIATSENIENVLDKVGLPKSLAAAAESDQYDAELEKESEEALSRTGKDVGTPIITYNPPDGPSFFGPVISEIPETSADAAAYFDAVVTLLDWQGFAELKRSLRDTPQLKILGR